MAIWVCNLERGVSRDHISPPARNRAIMHEAHEGSKIRYYPGGRIGQIKALFHPAPSLDQLVGTASLPRTARRRPLLSHGAGGHGAGGKKPRISARACATRIASTIAGKALASSWERRTAVRLSFSGDSSILWGDPREQDTGCGVSLPLGTSHRMCLD
jgi:hypothetical protein